LLKGRQYRVRHGITGVALVGAGNDLQHGLKITLADRHATGHLSLHRTA
jgi:hypothetical protein